MTGLNVIAVNVNVEGVNTAVKAEEKPASEETEVEVEE